MAGLQEPGRNPSQPLILSTVLYCGKDKDYWFYWHFLIKFTGSQVDNRSPELHNHEGSCMFATGAFIKVDFLSFCVRSPTVFQKQINHVMLTFLMGPIHNYPFSSILLRSNGINRNSSSSDRVSQKEKTKLPLNREKS